MRWKRNLEVNEKPKQDQRFWYIYVATFGFCVGSNEYDGVILHTANGYWESGNCFRTRRIARKILSNCGELMIQASRHDNILEDEPIGQI